jgi:hypothetical protein
MAWMIHDEGHGLSFQALKILARFCGRQPEPPDYCRVCNSQCRKPLCFIGPEFFILAGLSQQPARIIKTPVFHSSDLITYCVPAVAQT